MRRLLTWFGAKRWRLSLSHCVEGLLVQVPATVLFDPITGAVAVVVWYWSRKKLEVEDEHGHGDNPVSTWRIGWWPWEWDKYKQLDVLLPTLSSVMFAAVATNL